MKNIFLIFCTSFCISTVTGQSNILIDKNPKFTTEVNYNSKSFIRILDGFLLPNNYTVPNYLQINTIRRLNDSIELKEIGIKRPFVPYMFLSSLSSNTRIYIYRKANVNKELQEINLPIILNNELITFQKYSRLDNLDIKTIKLVKYLKSPEIKTIDGFAFPFGLIKVSTK